MSDMISIPSSENLFKFMFLGGLSLVLLAFLYPLQKEQELELQKNDYAEQVQLLKFDIQNLSAKVAILVKENTDTAAYIIDKSTVGKLKTAELKAVEFRQSARIENGRTDKDLLHKKYISVESQQNKIKIIDAQIKYFKGFRWAMLLFGIPIGLAGLIGWIKQTDWTILWKRKSQTVH